MIEKPNEIKSWFFGKIKKIFKNLLQDWQMEKKKRHKLPTIQIKAMTTDLPCKYQLGILQKLYINKFDNLDKATSFLKSINYCNSFNIKQIIEYPCNY